MSSHSCDAVQGCLERSEIVQGQGRRQRCRRTGKPGTSAGALTLSSPLPCACGQRQPEAGMSEFKIGAATVRSVWEMNDSPFQLRHSSRCPATVPLRTWSVASARMLRQKDGRDGSWWISCASRTANWPSTGTSSRTRCTTTRNKSDQLSIQLVALLAGAQSYQSSGRRSPAPRHRHRAAPRSADRMEPAV